MGLFKNKQSGDHHIDVEAKNYNFYEKFMFGSDKLVDIGNKAYAETIKDTIIKADPIFAEVNVQELLNQLLVLRLEVIGLYWLHNLGEANAIEQSLHTKRYLHDKGLDALWDEMDGYTQAVAASVVNHAGIAKKPQIYKMRADLADDYIEKYSLANDEADGKLEAIGKVINRKDSEAAWKKDLTKYYLAITLWKKLNNGQPAQDLNSEAYQQIMFAIRGLYEGTAEGL